MPPSKKSLEELVSSLSTQLEQISEQLTSVTARMDKQDSRFDRLEALLADLTKENSALKEANRVFCADNIALREKVTKLEQRDRAPCVRIFDFPISGDSSDNVIVTEQIYQELFLPILHGALQKKRISAIPSPSELIETAHILPSPNGTKPLFCRFARTSFKTLIMQTKRDHIPRGPAVNGRPGPFKYKIFEDMTRDFYKLMKKMNADSRINSCWFSAGSLRCKLPGSDTVARVANPFLSVDEIVAKR